MANEKFGIKLFRIEQPTENTVRLIVDFQGINKPEIFVSIAQLLIGKNFAEIWQFVGQFTGMIFNALKKSK